MNNKQKFQTFLESLKGRSDDILIESIQEGYQTCFEAIFDEAFAKLSHMLKLTYGPDTEFPFYKINYREYKKHILAKFKMKGGSDVNTFRNEMRRIGGSLGLELIKINKVNNMGLSPDMMLVYFRQVSLI